MMPLRSTSVFASVALHGAFILALIGYHGGAALDEGSGDDIVLTQHGIAIEGLINLGEARETVTAVDAPAAERSVAQEASEEVKPEEVPAVIASKAIAGGTVVEEAKPTPPLPSAEPPRPQQVAAIEQNDVVPTVSQQASSIARNGGDSTLFTKYLGSVRMALEKAKVNPGTRQRGTVVLRFTLAPSGEVLSREVAASSGSKILDAAAVAALDRAATKFKPFPEGVGSAPRNVTVPFEYVVR
jgi:periplasmic protein TonB